MMRCSKLDTLVIAAGMMAVGAFGVTTAARAAQPTQTDIDFCNKQAAEASSKIPKDSSTAAATRPATPAQPGTNPTGGRITDSSPPGTPPSMTGMAPAGETDLAYRQAYLACINQRAR
jgi:hypothetical protein